MEGKKVSDIFLERYLLGELPKIKTREIESLLEKSPDLRMRLEELEKSNIEILNEYPVDYISSEIKKRYNRSIVEKPGTKKSKKKIFLKHNKILYPSFGLLTAGLIFLFLFNFNHNIVVNKGIIEKTRIKGMKSGLYVFRKNNDKIEKIKNNSIVKANDLLQLAYVSVENLYGVIFSIDGRGIVTLHYPERVDLSTRLKLNKKMVLPSAYELDDAPDFERFFFVTSRFELNVEKILRSAEILASNIVRAATDDLKLEDNIKQISLTVLKEE